MNNFFNPQPAMTGMIAGLILWLSVLSSPAAIETNPSELFDKANHAFVESKYKEAISDYIRVIQQRGFSPNVLFNLGNAYFRDGQIGLAILSYERAQRLNPRDPDIAANLKRARVSAGVAVPEERWWQSMLTYLRQTEWAWLASLLLSLFCILATIRALRPNWIQWMGVSANFSVRAWRLILTLNGLVCFLAAACLAMSMQWRHEAVVIAKEGLVLISPYEKSNRVDSLPEGETVIAEKKHDRFIFIRYGKGQGGWIDEKQIATVEPDLLK
jgi:tetratricopeptide (TPR) repeat protein